MPDSVGDLAWRCEATVPGWQRGRGRALGFRHRSMAHHVSLPRTCGPPCEGMRQVTGVTTIKPMSNEFETLIVAVVAVAATFAATSHIPFGSSRVEEVVIEDGETAPERCVSMGVGRSSDDGQWPKTIAGEDASALIVSRCSVDVSAFESGELVMIQP
jgi:hypothetical protein